MASLMSANRRVVSGNAYIGRPGSAGPTTLGLDTTCLLIEGAEGAEARSRNTLQDTRACAIAQALCRVRETQRSPRLSGEQTQLRRRVGQMRTLTRFRPPGTCTRRAR